MTDENREIQASTIEEYLNELTLFYFVNVSAVNSIPFHAKGTVATFEALFTIWVIEARNTGKAGLELAEISGCK